MKMTDGHKQRAALILIFALGFAPSALLAQRAASLAPKPSKATQAEREVSHGGPQEGIKVHGHWTIVIKNPDGSVASHHDFENSLYHGGGDFILAGVLSRNLSIGMWGVLLDGPSGAQPCFSSSLNAATGCMINEPNGPTLVSPQIFSTLTIQRTGDLRGLILSGSATSANGGQISMVGTHLLYCDASTLPSSCSGLFASPRQVTAYALPAPLTLQPGQIAQVTVTITFS